MHYINLITLRKCLYLIICKQKKQAPFVTLLENYDKFAAKPEYASAIGSMMYVMHCTRPDIPFAVCKHSRYRNNPSTYHWKTIGRIIGYLKRKVNLGLFYYAFPAVLGY
ncbi:hypothetical protein ACOSQ3_003321 [Xanthoceras sorbifolium]